MSEERERVKPQELTGLRQAVFILKCFCEGKEEAEIIRFFDGDRQVVEMWRCFLIHNQWMEKPDGKWIATRKGEERIEQIPLRAS